MGLKLAAGSLESQPRLATWKYPKWHDAVSEYVRLCKSEQWIGHTQLHMRDTRCAERKSLVHV